MYKEEDDLLLVECIAQPNATSRIHIPSPFFTFIAA
jgi:hypothetical protein